MGSNDFVEWVEGKDCWRAPPGLSKQVLGFQKWKTHQDLNRRIKKTAFGIDYLKNYSHDPDAQIQNEPDVKFLTYLTDFGDKEASGTYLTPLWPWDETVSGLGQGYIPPMLMPTYALAA